MSPVAEIRWVAQRELSRSFRSAKGIVLLVLSLLGGTAVTMLLVWIQKLKRENLADFSPEAIHAAREKAMSAAFNDPATGKALADVPEVLLAVFFITVWLTPMLISLLGFDSVAGDLQHKSVRYWALRTRRFSYIIGKWFGILATVSLITLSMHVLIWILCVARGEAPFATALGWGLRLWAITLPISAVWCAIATFVSSIFRAPILALLVTFAAFFTLWLVWVIGMRAEADWLLYFYPNYYDALLIHHQPSRWAGGLAACLAMVGVYVGASSLLFTKRDV